MCICDIRAVGITLSLFLVNFNKYGKIQFIDTVVKDERLTGHRKQPSNSFVYSLYVQGYPWAPGIPHGVNLRTSNPQSATRPRLQVPPTAMLYAPSPIRLHNPGCPNLEQIAGWRVNATSVKSFKIILDAHWQSLFSEEPILPTSSDNPFPQHTSTHGKKTHPNHPSHMPPPPHLVVYNSLCCFVD